jgi:sphinganine-1-phosphate aldolase
MPLQAHGAARRAAAILPPRAVGEAGRAAQSIVAALQPAAEAIRPFADAASAKARVHVVAAKAWLDAQLQGVDPASALLIGLTLALLAFVLFRLVARVLRPFLERGFLPVVFDTVRSLPGVSTYLVRNDASSSPLQLLTMQASLLLWGFPCPVQAKEKAKLRSQLLESREAKRRGGQGPLLRLPERSCSAEEVMACIRERAAGDVQARAIHDTCSFSSTSL